MKGLAEVEGTPIIGLDVWEQLIPQLPESSPEIRRSILECG